VKSALRAKCGHQGRTHLVRLVSFLIGGVDITFVCHDVPMSCCNFLRSGKELVL
jgi:hypothetical protein